MRRIVSFGPAFVVLVAVVSALWMAPRLVAHMRHEATVTRVALAQQVIEQDDILGRLQSQTRAIADAVEPSVVHIEVRSFRGPAGSGWVFDEDGHIVTNAHVVRGSETVSVQFSDGRLARAEVVGADTFTDIAVLKLDPGVGVTPARRAGATDVVRQGDIVFAFGSPFGFKFSMSQGIVSGLGRAPSGALEFGGFTNFIQTDAAVNPGNSGGPLVDIRGRVIGMNVAIATGADSRGTTGDGQSAGISFAIPMGTIESVVTQLIDSGTVRRGYLGIQMNASLQRVVVDDRFLGAGVPISAINPPDGPAGQAGLRPGDVILRVAGRELVNSDVLRSLISSRQPGESVTIDVLRNGEPASFDVVLGEFPTVALLDGQARIRLLGRLGIRDFDETDEGVELTRVLERTPLARAGVEDGDVVTRVGRSRVRAIDDLAVALFENGIQDGRSVVVALRDAETDQPFTVELRLR